MSINSIITTIHRCPFGKPSSVDVEKSMEQKNDNNNLQQTTKTTTTTSNKEDVIAALEKLAT